MASQTTPLQLGGMHAGGAGQLIADGATRRLQNMLHRPGPVLERRAPVALGVSLSPDFVGGFANWLDTANLIQRTIAFSIDNFGSGTEPFVSASNGGFGLSLIPAASVNGTGAITAFANFSGKCYICTASNTAPVNIATYNGSAVSSGAIEGGQLTARCVVSYINRLFFGFMLAGFTNGLGTSFSYDPTVWTAASATSSLIANGDAITGRVTPTADTGTQIYKRNHLSVGTTQAARYTFSWSVRGVSPSYSLPVTLEIYYSLAWAAGTAYSVGAIRVPTSATGNGFRYRCTVAGTSHAATEPTWPTEAGATVADNTVTWVCDGPDALARTEATVPSASDSLDPTPLSVTGSVPPLPVSTSIGLRLKFGTSATPTYTRAPLDVSFRDGIADGTVGKANFGAQFTSGNFAYPFFNAEDTDTVSLSLDADLYWTDPFDPDTIKADYFYRLHESPGPVTAMCVIGKRLVVFKQYGIWVFAPNIEDPDNPIVLERFIANYGCKGPRAATVFGGKIYFVGNPDELYVFDIDGDPVPLAGDAMRTRLFAQSDTFADSATNSWYITADETNRDLYVTTRTSETGVFDLDGQGWSTFVYNGGAMHQQLWNPSNGAVYFADAAPGAVTATEALYLSGDTASALDYNGVDVESYVEFRPLAAVFPRKELKLEAIGLLHQTTGTQAAQTTKLEISRDGGGTWDRSATFTMPTVANATLADRASISGLAQSGHNLAVRLYQTGKGGAEMLRLAAADAVITTLTETERITNPVTITAATLT